MGKYTEFKKILDEHIKVYECIVSAYKNIPERSKICDKLKLMIEGRSTDNPRAIYGELEKMAKLSIDPIINLDENDTIRGSEGEKETINSKTIAEIIKKLSKYDLEYRTQGVGKYNFKELLEYLKSLPNTMVFQEYINSLEKVLGELYFARATGGKNDDTLNRIKAMIDGLMLCIARKFGAYVNNRVVDENMQWPTPILTPLEKEARKRLDFARDINKKISDDELLDDVSEEDIAGIDGIIAEYSRDTSAIYYSAFVAVITIKNLREDQGIRDKKAMEQKEKVQKTTTQEVVTPTKKKVVTFDNLDTSRFTSEELGIINSIRMIISSIGVGTGKYENIPLTVEARLLAYEKDSLKNVLADVNYLLNNIYDDKDNVIAIFNEIVKKYVRFVKSGHCKDLEEIKDIPETLISRVSRECFAKDYKKSMNWVEHLTNVQSDINDCIPVAESELEEDSFGEYDEIVVRNIVRAKEEISLVARGAQFRDFDFKTSNLLFNLGDSQITDPEFVKEYKSAIQNLEYRKLYDMRMFSVGSSLYPLSIGKEDFVTYIKGFTGRRPRFIPSIYSGLGTIKTVVIEFKPSSAVRAYLEKKYGVLNDGNYYGTYRMISEDEIKHNGYNNLAEELVKSFSDIQKIGEIFEKEEPTKEELSFLDSVIEKGLKVKEELRFSSVNVQK